MRVDERDAPPFCGPVKCAWPSHVHLSPSHVHSHSGFVHLCAARKCPEAAWEGVRSGRGGINLLKVGGAIGRSERDDAPIAEVVIIGSPFRGPDAASSPRSAASLREVAAMEMGRRGGGGGVGGVSLFIES